MSEKLVEEILVKTEQLNLEEKLHVIDMLTEKIKHTMASKKKNKRRWSDLVGCLPYPSCGEDAQTYISENRKEADSCREPLM